MPQEGNSSLEGRIEAAVGRKQVSTIEDLRDSYNRQQAWIEKDVTDLQTHAYCRAMIPINEWIIRSVLEVENGKRLLDVSCGPGVLLACANKAGVGAYGIDLADVAVRGARRLTGSLIAQANAEYLPFQNSSFHYVTCLGSLEHYLDPVAAVGEIARVLEDDGIACISLPNLYYWRHIWKAIRTGDGPSHNQDLERFASVNDWSNLLQSGGLHIIKVTSWPHGVTRKDLLRRPGLSIKRFVKGMVLPFNLASEFVFLCNRI